MIVVLDNSGGNGSMRIYAEKCARGDRVIVLDIRDAQIVWIVRS